MKLPFGTTGFPESNISQRNRNNCKQKNNTSKKIYFGKIHNSFLLKMYATTNATERKIGSNLNIANKFTII